MKCSCLNGLTIFWDTLYITTCFPVSNTKPTEIALMVALCKNFQGFWLAGNNAPANKEPY